MQASKGCSWSFLMASLKVLSSNNNNCPRGIVMLVTILISASWAHALMCNAELMSSSRWSPHLMSISCGHRPVLVMNAHESLYNFLAVLNCLVAHSPLFISNEQFFVLWVQPTLHMVFNLAFFRDLLQEPPPSAVPSTDCLVSPLWRHMLWFG